MCNAGRSFIFVVAGCGWLWQKSATPTFFGRRSLPNSPGKKLLAGPFFFFENGACQALLNTL
jgi:hypothetical protein